MIEGWGDALANGAQIAIHDFLTPKVTEIKRHRRDKLRNHTPDTPMRKPAGGEMVEEGEQLGRIGRYTLVTKIGGIDSFPPVLIYRAFDKSTGREVMLTVNPFVKQDSEFRERFLQQAQIAARLEHPHILPLYDYRVESDHGYIVNRMLDGGDLATCLREQEKLSPPATRKLLGQIGEALDYIHSKGFVHDSIDLHNILFDLRQNAYISDFSNATVIGAERSSMAIWEEPETEASLVLGNPKYSPPEVLGGSQLTIQSDIYSFGLVIYEALTGSNPYDYKHDSIRMIVEKLEGKLPMPPSELQDELTDHIDRSIFRAISPDPDERHRTVIEFVEELDTALAGI